MKEEVIEARYPFLDNELPFDVLIEIVDCQDLHKKVISFVQLSAKAIAQHITSKKYDTEDFYNLGVLQNYFSDLRPKIILCNRMSKGLQDYYELQRKLEETETELEEITVSLRQAEDELDEIRRELTPKQIQELDKRNNT